MIVGQAAVKLPIIEFFEVFQAQLIERKVSIGPCLTRETTLSDVRGYLQSCVTIGDDPKADAKELANGVAARADGKCISFAWLVVPRGGIEAANRIDQDQISIRLVAVKDIRTDEMIVRADVLFTTGETKP